MTLTLQEYNSIACAREITFAAGCPLRDRYGFAARDEHVLKVLQIISEWEDDKEAADQIGLANAVEEIEIAMGADEPADEEYELAIVRALRLGEERKRNGGYHPIEVSLYGRPKSSGPVLLLRQTIMPGTSWHELLPLPVEVSEIVVRG